MPFMLIKHKIAPVHPTLPSLTSSSPLTFPSTPHPGVSKPGPCSKLATTTVAGITKATTTTTAMGLRMTYYNKTNRSKLYGKQATTDETNQQHC